MGRHTYRTHPKTAQLVKTHVFVMQAGLTLVELLVDIALLSILLMFLVVLVNPFKQLEKAKDAKRQHDVMQLKEALDTYYNDHNCYPTELPYGEQWREGNTIYMKTVPQDDECTTKASCYVYQVDASMACPQWNILYAKKTVTPATTNDCPLQAFPDPCNPTNYDTSWSCALSGSMDCPYIAGTVIDIPAIAQPTGTPVPTSVPVPTVTPRPTPTPTPLPTLTPTPLPTPLPNCTKRFACTGGEPVRCNVVQDPNGVYCGFSGCFGGQCCNNACQ